jgi:hypothetical protein
MTAERSRIEHLGPWLNSRTGNKGVRARISAGLDSAWIQGQALKNDSGASQAG